MNDFKNSIFRTKNFVIEEHYQWVYCSTKYFRKGRSYKHMIFVGAEFVKSGRLG